MAKENKEWINSRACWRFSKYERRQGKYRRISYLQKTLGTLRGSYLNK